MFFSLTMTAPTWRRRQVERLLGVAIDVDSAGHRSGGDRNRLAHEVNVEVLARLPSLLRERKLSGRILVEFLELGTRANREALAEATPPRSAATGDPPAEIPDPRVRVLIVGSGPDLSRLRRLTSDLGVDSRVVFQSG